MDLSHSASCLSAILRDEVPMKNNHQHNDYRRLAALRDLGLDGAGHVQDCETIVGLAATFFNIPMVAVSLLERTEQIFVAQHGMVSTISRRADTLCDIVIEGGSPQIISDARADPRVYNRKMVTDAPFVRFYAGYPIRTAGGHIVGSFWMIDSKVRTFSPEEDAAFRQFGAIVEGMIQARARDIALKQSESERATNAQQLLRANSALAQAGRIAKLGRWEIDIKTMDVTWSDEVYQIHEIDLIESKSVLRAINYYADHDQTRVNAAVSDAIVYGTPFDFAADLISAKGNVRHVRAAGERDASGAGGSRIIGIIQDITDIVEARSVLSGAALQADDYSAADHEGRQLQS